MKRSSKQKTSRLRWTDFEMKRTLRLRSFKMSLIKCEKSKMRTTKIKINKFTTLQNSLKIKDPNLRKSLKTYKTSWLRLKKRVVESNQTMIMINDSCRRSFKRKSKLLNSCRANSQDHRMIIQTPHLKSQNLRKKFSQRMSRSMLRWLRTGIWSLNLSLKYGILLLKFKTEILESDP